MGCLSGKILRAQIQYRVPHAMLRIGKLGAVCIFQIGIQRHALIVGCKILQGLLRKGAAAIQASEILLLRAQFPHAGLHQRFQLLISIPETGHIAASQFYRL